MNEWTNQGNKQATVNQYICRHALNWVWEVSPTGRPMKQPCLEILSKMFPADMIASEMWRQAVAFIILLAHDEGKPMQTLCATVHHQIVTTLHRMTRSHGVACSLLTANYYCKIKLRDWLSGWLQSAVTKTKVTCCDALSSSSVVSCAFSAPCVYSKLGVILITWATFVPNFISFAASIAELAHGENQSVTQSHTESINHSPSLFNAPGIEAFGSESCEKIINGNKFDISVCAKKSKPIRTVATCQLRNWTTSGKCKPMLSHGDGDNMMGMKTK